MQIVGYIKCGENSTTTVIIFNENVYPETYLLAYRIVDACTNRKRIILPKLIDTDIRRIIVANGIYHIARAVAFLWRHGDDWNDLDKIRQEIQKLADEPNLLDTYFGNSLNIIVDIFKENEQFIQDPSVALKSIRLDEELDKELYSKRAHHKKSSKKSKKVAKKLLDL